MYIAGSQPDVETSERLYWNLFETAPYAHLVTDLQGVVQAANSAAGHLVGVAASDLIGRNLADYLPGETWQSLTVPQLTAAAESPPRVELESVLQCGASQHVPVALTLTPDRGSADRPALWYWTLQPLERSPLERPPENETAVRTEVDLLVQAVQALSHPFCVISLRDHVIVAANAAAGAVQGQLCYEALHGLAAPCGLTEPEHGFCPIKAIERTRSPVMMEHMHRDAQGDVHTVEVHGYPVWDDGGNLAYVVETMQDITPQRQAEIALQESEAQWRSLAEYSPDHVMLLDRDARVLFINRIPPWLLRRPAAGASVYDVARPQDRATIAAALARAVTTGRAARFEAEHVLADGQPLVFEAHVGPVLHDDEVWGFIVTTSDVSARHAVEMRLRTLAEDLDAKVRMLNCLYGVSALAHRYDLSLPNILQWTVELIPSAFESPDAIGARVIVDDVVATTPQFAPTNARLAADIVVHQVRRGVLEVCHADPDGAADAAVFHEEEKALVEAIAAHLSSAVDWMEAEAALAASEARYRNLVETIQEGIWAVDAEGVTTYVNPRMAEMLGYTVEEMVGKSVFAFEDERWAEISRYNLVRRRQGIREQHDLELRHKDGQPIHVRMVSTPLYDEAGEYAGALAGVQDVTAQRRAAEALRKSEALLQETQQLARLGGWELDLATDELQWTEEVYAIHELPRDVQPTVADALAFYPDEGRQLLEQAIGLAAASGKPWDLELPFVTATGRHLWVRATGRAELQQGKPARLTGMFQDITDRKEAYIALAAAHDEMEQRVLERTADLSQVNAELRALTRTEQRQRELAESLGEAVIAVASSLDLDEVLDRILAQTQRVVGDYPVVISLVRDGVIYLSRHRGLSDCPEACESLAGAFALDAIPVLRTIALGRQPVLRDVPERGALWARVAGFAWVRCYGGVPLLQGERVIGVLNILSGEPGSFDHETIAQLETFAAPAVAAIRNAEAYEGERQSRQVAEALARASRALTQTLNLDIVLDTLLDFLLRLIPYDRGTIMLLQEPSLGTVRATRVPSDGHVARVPRDQTVDLHASRYLKEVIAQKQSVLIADTQQITDWQHPLGDDTFRTWLSIPLVAGEEAIGICSLDGIAPGRFAAHQVQLAEALVNQAAVAVENARLFEQVQRGRKRLQSLTRQLVDVQESERQYIARELHDEAGQAMTSLIVGLRLAERDAARPNAVLRDISGLKTLAESVLENLHRLAVNLRPASLDHLGLVPALEQHLEEIGDRHGLAVQFDTVNAEQRLPAQIETAVYRIVQEALTNVVRHARATQVEVLLAQKERQLVVVVEDNGVGFDTTATVEEGHLGLLGMRERVDMLGGRVIIESAPGRGTALQLEVPLGDSHHHRG